MTLPSHFSTTGSNASSGTTASLSQPASTVTGDKVLIIASSNGTATVSIPQSGWNKTVDVKTSSSYDRLVVFEGVVGTAVFPAVLTYSASISKAYSVVVIRDADPAALCEYTATSAASGTTTITTPSITPSWGATDMLVLTILGISNGSTGAPTIPSGWATRQGSAQGANTAEYYSYKTYTTSPVTLTAWTKVSSSFVGGVTLAIKGLTSSAVQKIAVGDTLLPMDKLYVGDTKVNRVYVGDTLVFDDV